MDESYPALGFDSAGQCRFCRDALRRQPHEWWPGSEGERRTNQLVARLKQHGRGRTYDALVGLSGGIDSAYLAHLASRRYGLRLLAVHVDGGWDTEPAVRNIESIVRGLDIDLHTQVIEWHEMRDLQVAFLKASVLNQDIPQDHAFFATLYRTAIRFGIHDFLSGVNFSTECIVPSLESSSMDGRHVRAIHDLFGQVPLRTFPIMPLTEYLWITRVRKQLAIHRPLNYLDYNKEQAMGELQTEYGWRDYGRKHGESRFTKFYQEIYLPRKFGLDKRRLHLSSLVVSGQLSREQALAKLKEPITELGQARRDMKFIAKKLGVTYEDLEVLISAPEVKHSAYPNDLALLRPLSMLKGAIRFVAEGANNLAR